MGADELRAIVRAAFPVSSPPPAAVATCDCPECVALAADFRDLRWDEVPAAVLDEHSADLPLLGVEAFGYLLPAYLLGALGDPGGSVAEFLVYSLDNARWPRCEWPLSGPQLAVVDSVHGWLRGRWAA